MLPHKPSKVGFTLIELLVVIATIAILASILFPVFARSRDKARQVACLHNLVNIGMALQIYASDHDGQLLPGEWDLSLLMPRYLPDEELLVCPSTESRVMKVRPRRPGGGDIEVSYHYCPGRRLSQSPAQWLCSDSRPVHNQGANVLFTDGNVARLPEAQWRATDIPHIMTGAQAPKVEDGMVPGGLGPPPSAPPTLAPEQPPPPPAEIDGRATRADDEQACGTSADTPSGAKHETADPQ